LVDLANREFKLAKQKQRPDVSQNLVTLGTCTPPSSSSPSELRKVEIGLIVVGIALGILTALLVWLWFRVRKLRKAIEAQPKPPVTRPQPPPPPPPPPVPRGVHGNGSGGGGGDGGGGRGGGGGATKWHRLLLCRCEA
jgi:hypothetical protein